VVDNQRPVYLMYRDFANNMPNEVLVDGPKSRSERD
jgi:hypothetical protein